MAYIHDHTQGLNPGPSAYETCVAITLPARKDAGGELGVAMWYAGKLYGIFLVSVLPM